MAYHCKPNYRPLREALDAPDGFLASRQPLERMLRVYFLQLWFNLSGPEEALYDSAAMSAFARLGARWSGI